MKLSDFRRIGAAGLIIVGAVAPVLVPEIKVGDIETAVTDFDKIVTAGSSLGAFLLVLWSKVASLTKRD